MSDHLDRQPEPSRRTSFLTELEFFGEASFLLPSDKVVVKDMVLGAGGSALAHFIALMAAVLLSFMQTPLPPRESFVTVNLVEMGGSHSDFGDTGSLEGASGVQDRDMPPNGAREQEKTPTLERLKTMKQVEPVSASKEETKKRAPPRPAPRSSPDRIPPDVALEESPAPAAPSSPLATVETALTGAAEGKGQGARAEGEGAGFSASGGSSAGAGMHGGEFGADAVDKVPQAVHKVEPIYPRKARKEGVYGRVVLKFLVEPNGHVSRPTIQEANPAGYFEQTALEAIRHWRFKPGMYRGKAVATWVVMPVQFRLTE